MDSREQFEAWWTDKTFTMGDLPKAMMGVVKEKYFECWQASRAAVVVELPSGDDGRKVFPEDYRQAIEAAGVKVAV